MAAVVAAAGACRSWRCTGAAHSAAMADRAVYGDVVGRGPSASSPTGSAPSLAAGVAAEQVVLDPGLGFAKTRRAQLGAAGGAGRVSSRWAGPVLVAASRKGFLGRLLAGPRRRAPAGGRRGSDATAAVTALAGRRAGPGRCGCTRCGPSADAVRVAAAWPRRPAPGWQGGPRDPGRAAGRGGGGQRRALRRLRGRRPGPDDRALGRRRPPRRRRRGDLRAPRLGAGARPRAGAALVGAGDGEHRATSSSSSADVARARRGRHRRGDLHREHPHQRRATAPGTPGWSRRTSSTGAPTAGGSRCTTARRCSATPSWTELRCAVPARGPDPGRGYRPRLST